MRVGLFEVSTQKAALKELVQIVERSTIDPTIRNAALLITRDCSSRDDECEINAVFDAIKTGTDAVEGMENGVKYVSDPLWADFFTVPARLLKQLAIGVNGEDCDGQAMFSAALLGSLGFTVGLRIWGQKKGEYTHVYSVVGLPKIDWKNLIALDTTVEEATPGWEPPGGYTLTALLSGG